MCVERSFLLFQRPSHRVKWKGKNKLEKQSLEIMADIKTTGRLVCRLPLYGRLVIIVTGISENRIQCKIIITIRDLFQWLHDKQKHAHKYRQTANRHCAPRMQQHLQRKQSKCPESPLWIWLPHGNGNQHSFKRTYARTLSFEPQPSMRLH